MSEVTGKLVELNTDAVSITAAGKEFRHLLLKLDSVDKPFKVGKASPAGKFAERLDLKVGDNVTVVTGGQYNSVMKIIKPRSGGAAKTFSAKPAAKAFDSDGAKRGQAMNTAVSILLHNATIEKKAIRLEDEGKLEAFARMVFRVSTALEKPEASHPAVREATLEDEAGFSDDIDF